MNHIFDSHAHYDDKMFDEDRDTLIDSLPKKDVCGVVNCAVDIESSYKCLELSKKYSFIFAAVGIYPHETSNLNKDYIHTLESMLKEEKAVALGEIGLDYHYDFSPKSDQIKAFDEQLVLANKLNKPVIVHDREAHQDTLDLLKKYKPKGVIHCFSGSYEMAKEIVKLGMYIGVGGAVTFKNAKKILEVVRNIPIENILVETDAPYMTPVPFRGKRCDSSYIKYTAEKIAEIKGISTLEVLTLTSENACKLFGINQKELI